MLEVARVTCIFGNLWLGVFPYSKKRRSFDIVFNGDELRGNNQRPVYPCN
jgi:hypothetical protein